jgi:hypothetical protein
MNFSVQSLGYVLSLPIFACYDCTPPPPPTPVIVSCRPLVAPPSYPLFALACWRILSPHPLIALPSCPLLAPAVCCIASYHAVLSLSCHFAVLLFDIPFFDDWQKNGEHRQSLTDRGNQHKNT